MKIRELFETWYEPLKSFLNSQGFISIGKQIAKDRQHYEIIPSKTDDLMFKVFRITPYDSVKVVILGQDPYYNPIDAFDGLAFSNSTLLNAQPSLRNILKEVEVDIYDSFDLNTIGDLDLTRWAEQGVLLINTAMSVKQHLANSHTELWRPFTLAVIKAICERNDIVWILWGRKAQNYKQFIKNSSHAILESAHPSPLGCHYEAPIKFTGSKPFSKCNKELESRNLKSIIW
jgi:uracil-DNA glycosylase